MERASVEGDECIWVCNWLEVSFCILGTCLNEICKIEATE